MDNQSKPTVLDLFCGAGGFSQGFEQAGFNVIAGIDRDNDALATFYCNHDADAFNIDLKKLSPSEVFAEIGLRPRDVDVVIGGPPCQGHSGMGKKDPDDPRNTLVWDYLDIIKYAEPQAIVMENVSDIKDTDDGGFLPKVIDRVQEMGFNTTSGVLTAEDFGISQTRERFFLVGVQDGTPVLPAPTSITKPVYEVLNQVQLRDDLPNNDWRAQKGKHGSSVIDQYYDTPAGVDPYAKSDHQVRLALDRPARTIVAANSHFHPNQPRYLTTREAAAIQTFPDDYLFFGGVTSQREQVGNAVPPKLAEYIAREVRASLTNVTGQTTLIDHGFAVSD